MEGIIFVAFVLIARLCTSKETLRRLEAEEIREIQEEN
jgi:uncharacterized integral membrane protein